MLGAIEKRIRLLGLDRVSAGHEAPGKVVDSGFWEHVLEEREGKIEGVPGRACRRQLREERSRRVVVEAARQPLATSARL